jgi:hypothetical protein
MDRAGIELHDACLREQDALRRWLLYRKRLPEGCVGKVREVEVELVGVRLRQGCQSPL